MINITESKDGDLVVEMNFWYIEPTEEAIAKLGVDHRIERVHGQQLLPSFLLEKCENEEERIEATKATVDRLLAAIGPTLYSAYVERVASSAASDEEHEESIEASIDEIVESVPDEVSMPNIELGAE